MIPPAIIYRKWPIAICRNGNFWTTSEDAMRKLVRTCHDRLLTRALPTALTTASHTASLYLDNWVVLHWILKHYLTDNEKQFISKFFEPLCVFLDNEHITMTVYFPQTNRQAESFNNTIVVWLQHYLGEHQRDRDVNMQLVTYAYNARMQRSTNSSLFSLVVLGLPLTYSFWQFYSFTDWRKSDNISAHLNGKTKNCVTTVSRHRIADEIVAAKI